MQEEKSYSFYAPRTNVYKEGNEESGQLRKIIGVVLPLLVFAGAIFARVWYYLSHFVPDAGILTYFEKALVQEENTVEIVFDGIAYFYTNVLSVLLSFLGNNQSAVVVVQIVVQLIAIIFCYLALRKMISKTGALVAFAILAFLPPVVKYCFSITPGNLLFFLFSAVLLLIGFYKGFCAKKERPFILQIVFLLFLGLICGYVTYLDVTGLILLVTLFVAVFLKKQDTSNNFGTVGAVLLGLLCGIIIMFTVEGVFYGRSIPDALGAWSVRVVSAFSFDALLGLETGYFLVLMVYVSILISIVAVFYIQHIMGEDEDVFSVQKTTKKGSAPMTNQGVITSTRPTYEERKAAREAAAAKPIEKEKKTDATPQKAMSLPDKIQNTEVPRETQKEIKYIENPLPVPKRHVKKTLDFDFTPRRSQMHYDIDVEPDDDFDMK